MYKEILQEIRRNAGLDKNGKPVDYSKGSVIMPHKELSFRDIQSEKIKLNSK